MANVKASDPHIDAKMFPCVYPYGTGSAFSEPGTGQPHRTCKNRLLALQSWFRRSPRLPFYELDKAIKRDLYFKHLSRGRSLAGAGSAGSNADKFTCAFGSVVPAKQPESPAWWRNQSRDLGAITDDCEAGPRLMLR